jgi:KAP family P-loop domain
LQRGYVSTILKFIAEREDSFSMTTSNDIWADDLLGRKAEAEMLHEVLVMEANECSRPGREHAFVLALDAAYGEGKTFFLRKLREHLGSEHPVSFVDAWADDANEQPLLAIMSAINDSLEPYLKPGSTATKWLRNATVAALPIIAKVATGTVKTLIKKHVGDDIPDQIDAMLKDDMNARPGTEEEVILGSLDEAGASISSLADNMGAQMLASYKARQSSKATFKRNMRKLDASKNR